MSRGSSACEKQITIFPRECNDQTAFSVFQMVAPLMGNLANSCSIVKETAGWKLRPWQAPWACRSPSGGARPRITLCAAGFSTSFLQSAGLSVISPSGKGKGTGRTPEPRRGHGVTGCDCRAAVSPLAFFHGAHRPARIFRQPVPPSDLPSDAADPGRGIRDSRPGGRHSQPPSIVIRFRRGQAKPGPRGSCA